MSLSVPLSRTGGDTSPPVRAQVPPVVRMARPAWMEDDAPSPDKMLFAWTQEERGKRFPGAIPEAPPPGWATWYAGALAAVGSDEARLRAAWLAWLEDAWGQARQPVCAARAFIGPEVWRRHVPGQGSQAAPPEAPALPATEAGTTWGQVLAALRTDGKRYVAEQLARLTPTLEGDMLFLEAPDRFAAALVQDDYLSLIESALARLDVSARAVVIHAADTH
ncbi:hypothetical protein HJC22_41385 [Corallococcus exiguus]|uniref:hypothetical protein n=1 Tax=Corallococcus exiguus TaxID=83462 RepID=UPI001471C849|nr:hypothetical protein [Corallococcus exiguus]NNC22164.1 hypothetical protein [Corallococcus exiguus]